MNHWPSFFLVVACSFGTTNLVKWLYGELPLWYYLLVGFSWAAVYWVIVLRRRKVGTK